MKKPAIKSKVISVKNHVRRNQVKYAIAGTAMVFLYIQYKASEQWTEFLTEKGIDPMEFFNPEYFAELNS
jgi:LPS sulfotransferase NodH